MRARITVSVDRGSALARLLSLAEQGLLTQEQRMNVKFKSGDTLVGLADGGAVVELVGTPEERIYVLDVVFQ